MGILLVAEAIPPETRLGGSCGLCSDRFRFRDSWLEVLMERHRILDNACHILCHSIGRRAWLGTAIRRAEPRSRKIGYGVRSPLVLRDIRMHQAITAELLSSGEL